MNDPRTTPILRITHPVPSQIPPLTPEHVECIASLLDQVPSLIESLEATPAESATLQAWATRDIARRYLQATHWNLETATAKLKASLQWRNEFKPSEIPPEEVEPEAVCGKGFVHGFSKDGQPVLYGCGRLDDLKTWDRNLRFCVFLVERAIGLMPEGVEKLTIVLDNEGLGLWNSPPVSFMLQLVSITEKHYPERLGHCILSSPSWFGWGLWNVISPFLDPAIKAKVFFADMGRKTATPTEQTPDELSSGAEKKEGKSASSWGSFFGLSEQQAATPPSEPSSSAAGGVWGSIFGGGETGKPSENSENTVGTGGWTDILDLIDADQLPVEFGGANEFTYTHEVYWKAICETGQQMPTSLPILECSPKPVIEPVAFTQEQEEQVKKLAAMVPEMVASLEGGVTAEETATLSAWCDISTVRRYLVSQKWVFNVAATKLRDTLQWRKDFKPDKITADEVEPEGVSGKSFISGFDRKGQPLLYSIHRLDKTKTFDRYLRYCIFLLEKCIRVMPPGVERMTFLIDNGGLGVFNAPPVSFVSKFIGIAEAHYPQRLDTAVMLNPSWFIFGLFRIISPFMDPVTRAKVHFANVGPNDHLNAGTSSSSTSSSDVNVEPGTGGWTNIFQYVDPSQLPAQYGGTHDFQYDHKVFWDLIKKV
ncbi:hypothetical protein CcCBS67573_g06734 [Chytriomyces confervae]|uniref:CRAL-TRIO domain-containing protein n=1 Tax=Chytriomyces confervae TaxID=246404 RepID=A0A507F0S8_9FUNG|nr:hypothetical protein CcCBS67573_g06734 [Chytriomyces confervae]